MISNERPSPYGRRPYQGHGYGAPKYNQQYNQQPRPPVNEDTLKAAEVQIERKNFVLTLKENPRGRFLRITEDVGGRRDTIMLPMPTPKVSVRTRGTSMPMSAAARGFWCTARMRRPVSV